MSRPLKKLVYGVFYLALFGLILFGVYKVIFGAKPTCVDGMRNQKETGVDCGGPCGSCDALSLKPFKVLAPIRIFHLSSGRVVFFAEVLNPNDSYLASQFIYRFVIYNRSSEVMETISGDGKIPAGGRTFLYSADFQENFLDIGKAELEFKDIKWEKSEGVSKINLISEVSGTEISESGTKVNGVIKNQDSLTVRNIKIIAVLSDKFGQEIFASQTIIPGLEGFKEQNFNIYFPFDSELMEKIDPNATKVHLVW